MPTTTSYGTWANHAGELTVEDTVRNVLGEFAGDYDVDAIAADYRDAINEAGPDGVVLAGDEFYGPYLRTERERAEAFRGYTVTEDGDLDVGKLVEDVDLYEIVREHETDPDLLPVVRTRGDVLEQISEAHNVFQRARDVMVSGDAPQEAKDEAALAGAAAAGALRALRWVLGHAQEPLDPTVDETVHSAEHARDKVAGARIDAELAKKG